MNLKNRKNQRRAKALAKLEKDLEYAQRESKRIRIPFSTQEMRIRAEIDSLKKKLNLAG